MSAEVFQGRQRSDGDYSYSAKAGLDKGRRITVYLNGDPNFLGAQMLVNRRQIRTWEAFLNASTQKTGVLTAVRYIATPETGTHLVDLEELRDRQSYVAITRGKFKPLGYTTLSERRKQYLEGNVHRTSSILKIKPVEHSHIQVPGKISMIPIRSVMINVFVNGKDFDAPYRIALTPKMMQSWRLVMKEIGEHIRGLVPKVLYTVDGKRIITQSADLESGGKYVIVGNEQFMPYSYGVFSRAKRHKKLPPIKLKRRLSKKPLDQDLSSSFQENPAEGSSGQVSQRTAQSIESKLPEIAVLDVESSIERSLLTQPSTSTPRSSSLVQRTASENLKSNVVLQHPPATRADKTKSAGEVEIQDSSAPALKKSEKNVKLKVPQANVLNSEPPVEKLLSAKSSTGPPKVNLSVQRVNSENFDTVPSPALKLSESSRSRLLVIPEIEPKTEQFPQEEQTTIEHEDDRQEYSVASITIEEEQTAIHHEENRQEYSIALASVEEEQTEIQHEDNRQEYSIALAAVEESNQTALESTKVMAEEKVREFDNTTDTNVEEDRLATEVTVEEIGKTQKVAEEEKDIEKEIEVEQTKQSKDDSGITRTDIEAVPNRNGISPSLTTSSEAEQLLGDDSSSSETKVIIKL